MTEALPWPTSVIEGELYGQKDVNGVKQNAVIYISLKNLHTKYREPSPNRTLKSFHKAVLPCKFLSRKRAITLTNLKKNSVRGYHVI